MGRARPSGQDPHTLEMILRDSSPQISGWNVRITATDLSEAMVERCKAGRFSEYELSRGLSATLRDRHFQRSADGWHAREELRRLVDVRQLNCSSRCPATSPSTSA